MKIIVAVVIHNRFENLQRWAQAWPQCEHEGDSWKAELRIIHNYYTEEEKKVWQEHCKNLNLPCISRFNVGRDIGALQDICRERLGGFDNDYTHMLWCTDDTIPMRKDFVKQYVEAMEAQRGGVVCMEISEEVTTHIRTSGVLTSKYTWTCFQFPVDPHVELAENYDFEHRGGDITMLSQVKRMGIPYSQISPLKSSPVWDIDKREDLARWAEWNEVFGMQKKVLFIVPVHNQFPQIASSLICQTHKNWHLLLIHDGLNHTGMKKYLDGIGDDRITFLELADHEGVWGHSRRRWALEELKKGLYPDADYVVVSNADNYYVPVFIEYMLTGFEKNPETVATFCDVTVHSYWGSTPNGLFRWAAGKCELKRGRIDCGGVMVKRDVAAATGWPSLDHSSDWDYFQKIIIEHGKERWVRVPGALFVHN
jgi:hypothetical protein